MANNDFESKWPLHTAVFKNDVTKLKHLLSDKHLSLDQKDLRGRTPLLLAVTLGHVDCARALLDAGANPNIEDNNGYGALQEAISIGDPEFIADIIHQRDLNRFSSRVHGVPAALLRLRDTKDFYVEMKWEFTSWLPMVSSFCPSDTYKIYKRGSKLRVDTTLVGFEQSSWQRGSRSFVFSCDEDGTRFMEFDHDLREVHVETIKTNDPTSSEMVQVLRPPLAAVHARMKSPISTTFLNTDNIGFERAKSGVIGFRSDRVEEVNGHESKVFYASPIEVVTKIRTEHLSPEDKARHKASTSRLTPFLPSIFTSESTGDDDTEHVVGNDADDASNRNPFNITPKEYFDPSVNLKPPRVIGLPREISTRIQRFKATLWLCESFPLSLPEQIAPVIDLMAISSSHFSKYRDFITLHLPQGFPVRIEIPLFRVLNAKITFGNILSLDSPVPNVTPIRDDTEAACVIEDEVFQPPPGYRISGQDAGRDWVAQDDEMMQLALDQYLLDDREAADQVTLWEALQTQQDPELQRAIQESLLEYQKRLGVRMTDGNSEQEGEEGMSGREGVGVRAAACALDFDLELALKVSAEERMHEEEKEREEEEILKRVLQLSLQEK